MSWFVLRTVYGSEIDVSGTVSGLGYPFRSFCPTYRSVEVVRRRKIIKMRPVWATYVLADWEDDGGVSWHQVMSIDGVLGVIGGENPTPVFDREVADLLREMDADGVVGSLETLIKNVRRGYVRGDIVRIVSDRIDSHPFDGHIGVCSWYDDSGASVKIPLLGREVSVYVSIDNARLVRVGESAAITRGKKRRERRRFLSEVIGVSA